MGKNEKKILSAISPAYALSKGRAPSGGLLGSLVNRALDKRDERKEKEKAMSGVNEQSVQQRENAGALPDTQVQQMKAGGKTRSVDGIARQGRTRGRVI